MAAAEVQEPLDRVQADGGKAILALHFAEERARPSEDLPPTFRVPVLPEVLADAHPIGVLRQICTEPCTKFWRHTIREDKSLLRQTYALRRRAKIRLRIYPPIQRLWISSIRVKAAGNQNLALDGSMDFHVVEDVIFIV